MHRVPLIHFTPSAVFIALSLFIFFSSCERDNSVHKNEMVKETIYHCPMHPNYLSHKPGNCPICGMKLVPAESPSQKSGEEKDSGIHYKNSDIQQFTQNNQAASIDTMSSTNNSAVENNNGNGIKIDPAMIQSIGVKIEKSAQRTLVRDIRTSATIKPDERRITAVSTKIMGYIEKLYVNYTGQYVSKGQPLYSVYSPDLVSAQEEYLGIYKSQKDDDNGQLLESAKKRLLNWDIPIEEISALETRGTVAKAITMLSPASGIVMERMISEGQSIESGMQLYKLIDYSRVWASGSVYEQDIPFINIGEKGTVTLDYYPGEQFSGTVSYIALELDIESRTLEVRLDLKNTKDLRLKSGMNATLIIHSAINRSAVTVPEEAVIRTGLRTLVIVSSGGGYFEAREIKTGYTASGYTEVLDGIKAGDDIVVSSQFLIDAESNLKAAIMKMNRTSREAEKDTSFLFSAKAPATIDNSVKAESPSHLSDAKAAHRHSNTQPSQVYTCPMHPEIRSSSAGSCPKCGMPLVPVKSSVKNDTAEKGDNESMKDMP